MISALAKEIMHGTYDARSALVYEYKRPNEKCMALNANDQRLQVDNVEEYTI